MIDEWDGLTKEPKLGHAVGRSNRVLGQNQHPVIIQCKELVKRNTADRVALAPWPTVVLLIPPESASGIEIQNKNLEETPWLFQAIIDHCLKEDD